MSEKDFGRRIKGQTLTQIFDGYFAGMPEAQRQITEDLNRFESQMTFEFMPGVVEFMEQLRDHRIGIAIVTSSNDQKMRHVYRAYTELRDWVDHILTSDFFTHSKPHPECFLLGATVFNTTPENCVVFEDSFHGLEAARRAGMKIVGLCTTNPREAIVDKANVVISDFTKFNIADFKDLFE